MRVDPDRLLRLTTEERTQPRQGSHFGLVCIRYTSDYPNEVASAFSSQPEQWIRITAPILEELIRVDVQLEAIAQRLPQRGFEPAIQSADAHVLEPVVITGATYVTDRSAHQMLRFPDTVIEHVEVLADRFYDDDLQATFLGLQHEFGVDKDVLTWLG